MFIKVYTFLLFQNTLLLLFRELSAKLFLRRTLLYGVHLRLLNLGRWVGVAVYQNGFKYRYLPLLAQRCVMSRRIFFLSLSRPGVETIGPIADPTYCSYTGCHRISTSPLTALYTTVALPDSQTNWLRLISVVLYSINDSIRCYLVPFISDSRHGPAVDLLLYPPGKSLLGKRRFWMLIS